MKKPSKILIALLSLNLAGYASAQNKKPEEESSKWYQIEILVFANNNMQDANQENWSQELGLKYPQRLVKLKTATQAAFLSADSAQTSSLNDVADNALTANPINSSNGSGALGSKKSTATTQKHEPAFILLDQQQLQLTAMARRILSQPDFRPLFHGAWRQPVSNREESVSIFMQGGEQFDNHFELEGSIKLSVERYLHLQTDLWFSQFTSNTGREHLPWPVLPSSPFRLNIDLAANGSDNALNNSDFANSNVQTEFGDHFSEQNLKQGLKQGLANSISNTSQPAFSNLSFDNPFYDLVGNLYSVEQTYTLRQDRRMRSDELHYIDHPLMGLLIKVTPYEPVTAEGAK